MPFTVSATDGAGAVATFAALKVFVVTAASEASGWSWQLSGATATYFVVFQNQAGPIHVGDVFTNSSGRGGPFTVTALDPPYAGYVNVSFTPAATSLMTTADTVTSIASATAGSAGSYGVTSDPVTPVQSGSVILFGLAQTNGTWTAYTAAAGNTFTDNAQYAATGYGYGYGYYSGAVNAGSPVTAGASDSTGWTASAACELIPHNGSPAIGGSSPAVATTAGTTPVTTGSFTPPAGAVLAAVFTCNSTATPAITMSDTSGLGLVWSQRAAYSASYEGTAIIFTATVPGGGTAIALTGIGTGTEAVSVPPVKSPPLVVYGFGTFPAVSPSDTINFVQVSVTEYQSSAAMPACSFELWANGITQIGTTQQGTKSQTPGNVSTAQFRPTYAQLATLQVWVYGNAPGGTGSTENVDAVGLLVDYTPAAGTPVALAGGGTGSDVLGGTTSLLVLTSSLPDAIEGAAYAAYLTASGGTPPYTWTVVTGSLPGWAALT